jgi:TRAP-type C4-dicarboxylate transport system permease small subunit
MNWKLLFAALFILFLSLSWMYANKTAVSYQKVSTEDVSKVTRDENGAAIILSHPHDVQRTYQENYAAAGGAIGFGIIAAAALVGLAIFVQSEHSLKNRS